MASSQLLLAAPLSAEVRTKLTQLWGEEMSDTKEYTPFEDMNKGPFFLILQWPLSWESWAKAALSAKATTVGKILNDDK